MIDIKTKIHDNFSIEFKIGFSGRRTVRENNFMINSWIFLPNSLDVNSYTYDKQLFYRDVKSNIRLITPVFLLRDVANADSTPFKNIRNAFNKLASTPTRTNISEYEFHLKLFAAIIKSSLRDEINLILKSKEVKDIVFLCKSYNSNINTILENYRELWKIINVPTIDDMYKHEFSYIDEYLSQTVEVHTIRLIDKFSRLDNESVGEVVNSLSHFLLKERDRKIKRGYAHITIHDAHSNRELVTRHGILKKFVESALYLKVNTTQDGKTAEQVSFGVAAGIAMAVTTLIAIPFQNHLGNYPSLIFIILVISYMLKDRMKEMMRNLFAYRLKSKYFDNKTIINIKDKEIGWIKEGMDFISDEKTPREVMNLRKRSEIEAENNLLEEKIILYRKKVYIDGETLKNHYEYNFSGINDIIRFHIHHLTDKMDNPDVFIKTIDKDMKIHEIRTHKTYTIYIVLQFQYEDQLEYKGFKIIATRNGIIEIDEVN